MDAYGNWSWKLDELEQTPMEDLSRRGRHVKRRHHQRLIRDDPEFVCECVLACDSLGMMKSSAGE